MDERLYLSDIHAGPSNDQEIPDVSHSQPGVGEINGVKFSSENYINYILKLDLNLLFISLCTVLVIFMINFIVIVSCTCTYRS